MRTASLASVSLRNRPAFDNATYTVVDVRQHRLRSVVPQIAREIDSAADVAANDWRGVLTVYVAAFAATLTFIL